MRNAFLLLLIAAAQLLHAQSANTRINEPAVQRIETTLASDEMRGRKTGTPDIDRAADFIAREFKKAGLQPVNDSGYLQRFTMTRPHFISASGEIDSMPVKEQNIIVVTSQPELTINENSGYEVKYIRAGDNIYQSVMPIMAAKKNQVVFVDTSFARLFPRLKGFKEMVMSTPTSVVFILGAYQPTHFTITARHRIEEVKLANVVGILPGRSKTDEYVIFSAHYDHLGIGAAAGADSIYNGANDDASGTTAVISLANYFKQLKKNERTLIFAAFTAEEIGGYGSQYFSRQLDPNKVVAMFNIEMIGTESKWGKNSAYITGFDKTNMGEILQRNLKGTGFTFYPDPYTKENLFYRSDNATLARLGVPAHTISTAKMENEPNYHKVSDEVSTLDLTNMTEIIKAIAISSTSIVRGIDTPTRVSPESLKK